MAKSDAAVAAVTSWNGDNDAAIARGGPALATLDSLAAEQPGDAALALELEQGGYGMVMPQAARA